MSVFTDRLTEMLERRGMTQRELADKIDKTEVSVSRYVSGQRVPKATVLLKIAQALNVQADYLLGNDSRGGTCAEGWRRMKLTIDLPDTTTAVSVTYMYVEGGEVMLANRLLDTADIDRKKEEQDD
jgi:transcriptional regulator with XRE-family HTH domain